MKPLTTEQGNTSEPPSDLFTRAVSHPEIKVFIERFPGAQVRSVQRLPDPVQSRAMLDAFASVGATSFDVTLLADQQNQEKGFQARRGLYQLRQSIERRLRAAAEQHHSVIIRPRSARTLLVQLDDFSDEETARIAPFAFLTFTTSPGNGQVWLAVSDGPKESEKDAARLFRARMRRGAGADHSATGATRIAGSINFKPKYAPDFPLVTLGQVNRGKTVTVAEFENAGLIAPPEEPAIPPPAVFLAKTSSTSQASSNPAHWPDWQRALRGAPLKGDGAPDRSMADFMFCKWAAQRGHDVNAIAEKLIEVSPKASEKAARGDTGYALLTARNATRAHERDRQRRPPFKSMRPAG